MAKVVCVLCASHSPFLYMPVEEWEVVSARRRSQGRIASDVPVDNADVNHEKAARCQSALEDLHQVLIDSRPDALLVFGDDQGEVFDLHHMPQFGVFVGEQFSGYKTIAKQGVWTPGQAGGLKPRTPEHWVTVTSMPHVAAELLVALLERDFDPALISEIPASGRGMSHAFMRPSYHLWPDFSLPVLPVFVNCYYGPQPTGRRCAQLGEALRRSIEALPQDLRIAVVGTGGLWHTPEGEDSCIDEEFDRAILSGVEKGDASSIAAYFDDRGRAISARSDRDVKRLSNGTGVVHGLGSGTGEVRNWIAAAGVAGATPGVVVDYVPVYASPCGMAFAKWTFN